MTKENLDKLRNELSVKAKNGIDFTLAASIIWLLVAYIWTLEYKSYDKSILVFVIGAALLPLAYAFSKILRTSWKIAGNPLEPLGLWLNFAQLFYFPFLIFTMIKSPDYFIMVYAIITGGHFFPYAWYYKTHWYAAFAGIIVIGALLLGLNLANDSLHLIAVFTSISLFVLTLGLYADSVRKAKMSIGS